MSIIVELRGEAEKEYKRLEAVVNDEKKKGIKNSQNQQLFQSIQRIADLLKQDPTYGSQISKPLLRKTGLPVNNLWIVKLTGYWRLLYTIIGNKVEVICYVLEICDHKKYDKIFGYRKK
ncbi:MAG: hypothetical protein V1887_02730 [Candidatus Aenigmatarchaeota archaeon]